MLSGADARLGKMPDEGTNASCAASYASSAVLIPSTLEGASARLARYCMLTKFGIAIDARMPMMATTIINSTRVNFLLFTVILHVLG